jgi:hypothetical protein
LIFSPFFKSAVSLFWRLAGGWFKFIKKEGKMTIVLWLFGLLVLGILGFFIYAHIHSTRYVQGLVDYFYGQMEAGRREKSRQESLNQINRKNQPQNQGSGYRPQPAQNQRSGYRGEPVLSGYYAEPMLWVHDGNQKTALKRVN